MDAAPMNGEKLSPSRDRPDPFGDPIVQGLSDARCAGRVDGENGRLRLQARDGVVNGDIDLVEPGELGDLFEVRRRVDTKAKRKTQRQNKRILERRAHNQSPASPRANNFTPNHGGQISFPVPSSSMEMGGRELNRSG